MNTKKNKNLTQKNETSEIRKDFYKRLVFILLCVIPIYFFANEKGTFRLVPLPFFLIGMYQLILLVQSSQFIIDDFFPPKIANEKIVKPFDKLIYYLALTLFGVSLVFLIFEINKIDNTINGIKLFWQSFIIGICLAIIITLILKSTNPSVYYESKRRYTVYFGLFIGLSLLLPASGSFINHYFAEKNKKCKSYKILRKGNSNGRRSTEYFIYLSVENENEERFSIRKSLYDELKENEKIELCLIKGKLGFEYVTDFNKIEN